MSGKVKASARKPTAKQAARSLRAAHAKIVKKQTALNKRIAALEAQKKDLDREAETTRKKLATLLSPFKKGQILKHVYRGEYVKITDVHCGRFLDLFVYGKRVKRDGSDYPGAKEKNLDATAWEALP